MFRLLCTALIAASVYAQVAARVVTILPASDRSAVGELRLLDKQATSHYVGFIAADSVAANRMWRLPATDAQNALCSDGSLGLSFACGNGSFSGTMTIGGNTTASGHLFTTLVGGADIGTVDNYWNNLFAKGVYGNYLAIATNSTPGGPLNFTSTWKFLPGDGSPGSLTLYDTGPSAFLQFNSGFIGARSTGIDSNFAPMTDVTRDLGDSGHRWNKLWVKDIDLTGTCTGCGTFPVSDATTILYNATDATKLLKFSLANLSTGTTRTLTAQNANYTLAGIDISNTFTANQSFSGHVYTTLIGLADIGSTSNYWNNLFAKGLYGNYLAIATTSYPGGPLTFTSTWKLQPGDGSPGTLTLTDTGPSNFLQFNSGFVGARATTIDSNFSPMSDITRDLGASTARWNKFWVKDIDISGTCTGCGGFPVSDSTAIVKNASDPTKLLKISLAGLTSGATRTLTVQDADYTLAGTTISNTFTVNQSFGGHLYTTLVGLADMGTTSNYWNNWYGKATYTNTLALPTTSYPGGPLTFTSTWKLQPGDGSPGTLTLTDTGPSNFLQFNSGFIGARATTIDSNFSPMSDITRDLGASTARWNKFWVKDIDSTGITTISNGTQSVTLSPNYVNIYGPGYAGPSLQISGNQTAVGTLYLQNSYASGIAAEIYGIVQFDKLTGTGNAAACLNAQGQLYRGPC